MAAATSVLAGVAVMLLAAHAGAALKCYSCFHTESVSRRCGDPFSRRNTDLLEDCDDVRPSGVSGHSFCKKIKQIKDRNLIVTRLCHWSSNETSVCDDVHGGGGADLELLHCSACRTDGCNGSGALLPTTALCMALLLLLLLLGA